MTRSISATMTAAVAEPVTQPIYLVDMGWVAPSPDVNRRIATWSADISWNSQVWQASGATVSKLDTSGGRLTLPNGNDDPWLALVMTQFPRGRSIDIYEHHTDFTASPVTADATLIFSGVMDGAAIDEKSIEIDFIEGLANKVFPVSTIDAATYTHLIQSGQRLYWGPDIVLVK